MKKSLSILLVTVIVLAAFPLTGIISFAETEGYSDSYIQTYENKNGIRFASLNAPECEHNNTERRNAYAPDCTHDGYNGDIYCSDCGEYLGLGEEIPALGHDDGEWRITAEPTQTVQGEKSLVCTRCGKVLKTEAIPKLVKNGFVKENGKYYYYVNGVMQKGWRDIRRGDGKTYKHYFDSNGVMASGWKSINNSNGVPYKYYFASNGCMRTGWQSIKNSKGVAYKYYFGDNGYMRTGWQSIKNSKGVAYKYYFHTNGVMLTNWQWIANSKGVKYKYYFGTNGYMRTGWQNITASNGKTYRFYFGANGFMRTGWQWIANSKGVKYRYYFGTNGIMRTGWKWIANSKGVAYKYYFFSNGVNAINRSVKIGAKTYKFNRYGVYVKAGSYVIDSASQTKTDEQTSEQNTAFYNFRTEQLLEEHFQKHGADTYCKTSSEYLAKANAVINNPNALKKTEAEDGDGVFYIEDTDEIVFLSTDGYIRTYFICSGKAYFDRQ